MGNFKLWIEGQTPDEEERRQKILRKKEVRRANIAAQPDSYFEEKVMHLLAKFNNISPWNQLHQYTELPLERFERIVNKLVQDKKIEIKKFSSRNSGNSRRMVVVYGTKFNSGPQEIELNPKNKKVSIDSFLRNDNDNRENKILEIIRRQNGNTTFANVDWEASRYPFIFPEKDIERRKNIKKMLEKFQKKKIVNIETVENKYRKDPTINISLVFKPKVYKLPPE